jgi:hypothetical protein
MVLRTLDPLEIATRFCQTALAPSSILAETPMCALRPKLHELAEQDRLLAALSDRRARVAHEACTVLAHDHVVPRERLWTLLATASRAHTRNCIVRLLARGERIDSMTWLLNAAAFADRAVRVQACTHLARWGSGWAKVPAQRLAAFRVALDRASPYLPDELRLRLQEYVRYVDGVEAAPSPQPRHLTPQRKPPRVLAQTPAPWVGIVRPLLRATASSVATALAEPQSHPLRLPGCVVLRQYELPPRRRAPWRWLLRR